MELYHKDLPIKSEDNDYSSVLASASAAGASSFFAAGSPAHSAFTASTSTFL